MNVYDFDNTIYDGDSTVDFYLFCLKRHPYLLIHLPKQIWGAILYKLGRITKVCFKEIFFCFLRELNSINKEVSLFWDIRESRIKKWYYVQQKSDDLIISASPFFLLKNICDRLQIKYLIASPVNAKTGEFEGDNCYGDEKVSQFLKAFPDSEIDEFYSDSVSDVPLAKLARKSYLVKKDIKTPWIFQDITDRGDCK